MSTFSGAFRLFAYVHLDGYGKFDDYCHMAITDKTLKILWGRAAGRCSAPNCQLDLTPLLEESGLIVIGEMAHVIGRREGAARGEPGSSPDDSYDNLILLCPNHHTHIDKAPVDYSVELLHQWKKSWESSVSVLRLSITSREQLFIEIYHRLVLSKQAYIEWGPESKRAHDSPLSCQSAKIWELRRVGVIVPNNLAIASLLQTYRTLTMPSEYPIIAAFIDHANFYAQHCIEPVDSSAYLKFPTAFGELVERIINGQ